MISLLARSLRGHHTKWSRPAHLPTGLYSENSVQANFMQKVHSPGPISQEPPWGRASPMGIMRKPGKAG
jgi:hypothetical protein